MPTLGKFILYDSKEYNPEDFNLERIQPCTKEELKESYSNLPILALNDFLLKSIYPKQRTDSHKLSELHIETLSDLEYQRDLINQKKSNLSRSERELVIQRYNEICA